MTDEVRVSQAQRITQIESDVGSLRSEFGEIKTSFTILGNTVKELSSDITAASHRQEALHRDNVHRQEAFQKEWRDQKERERNEHDQRIQARQLGPMQYVQMGVMLITVFSLSMGGFFFLVKAYVDGSVSPAILQLTERQQATNDANGRRNELIDGLRSDITRMTGTIADMERVTGDNRTTIIEFRDLAAKSADERSRLDERLKAQKEMTNMLFDLEVEARKTGDTALREELRQYKARAEGK